MIKTDALLERLFAYNNLDTGSLKRIIDECDDQLYEKISRYALEQRERYYNKKVYLRALLEFSNYCRNNCLYCGIRKANKMVSRFRLSINTIINCCSEAYSLGYRTFVLQGGEDEFFSSAVLSDLIQTLKKQYPDAAVTLSVGEMDKESYHLLHQSGADRFLLRHETSSERLYKQLHPAMSFENRINCLHNLKEIGYQTGAGFIVGLPGQDNLQLAEELSFLKVIEADMVGIGPLIVHPQTPLSGLKNGSVNKTFLLIALIRLLLPQSLIPVSTAVNTLDKNGWEKGLLAGANVIMPVISPETIREKYEIYKDKSNVDVSRLKDIKERINQAGFTVDMSRGDRYNFKGDTR